MVKVKDTVYINNDGTINLEAWLQHAATQRNEQDINLIRHACVLSQLAGENKPALTGISCLQQGLKMAEILLDLHLDKATIAAALVYSSVHYAELNIEDVREHLGDQVAKLVQGTMQMDAIKTLPGLASENHTQLENVRKMLLAMVEDMRVVLIKLAERTIIMRTLGAFDPITTKKFARETLEIYAPLANRLGIGQLKWELEDLSLRYLESETYKEIAESLHERRIDRENYVQQFVSDLKTILENAGLKKFEVYGRAKHIYSIYRKMYKKKLKFEDLYDLNAVRILVETIEDCYTALSIIHGSWQPIQNQFDDYIASPKLNGYRSIHTAVIGSNNKKIEVQIRTFEMHKESEHGVAAHWQYKESSQQKASYQAKIAWLRQVLEWQKELVKTGKSSDTTHAAVLDDRIYVFTPTGDIIDLAKGATPLDFAYSIHSEVGHRCRGAKVNGSIVPLTYILNTGEQVEILTAKQPNPSRDWLSPNLGYLFTARAKAKVHHWFKIQDYDKNVVEGQTILERECHRLGIVNVEQEQLAHKLHYKSKKDMYAALGSGDIRMAQVLHIIQTQHELEKSVHDIPTEIPLRAPRKTTPSGINIAGVGNLLTYAAACCKPVPGDEIIGFITQGKGVALHRHDCINILNLPIEKRGRLITVDWGQEAKEIYPVDIRIEAYDRPGLVRDITTLVANEKLNVIALTTSINRNEGTANIAVTIEIHGIASLSKILDRIKHIPNIIDAYRATQG